MGARIIAGIWGGRTIAVPPGNTTRPMTDQLRSALFNILGNIEGQQVVDAYAGSGAIGLEALSRGASAAVAIELAKSAVKTIQDNAAKLGAGENLQVYQGRVEDWLKTASLSRFDLVVAGPPFAELKLEVIASLGTVLLPGGLMVLWQSSRLPVVELDGLQLAQSRKYGDSTLVFYNR